MKQTKTNFEIRIFEKKTKKSKIISIATDLDHESLRQEIKDKLRDSKKIKLTGYTSREQ